MMFYRKKVERAMNWLKEKNEDYDKNDKHEDNEKIEYTWKDYFSVILSAFLVFAPIFIILFLLMYLVFPG